MKTISERDRSLAPLGPSRTFASPGDWRAIRPSGSKHGSRNWLLVFLLLTLTAVPAWGTRPPIQTDPEYLIDTWEIEDGLPDNSATALAQTPDGYLWFGTFNGLVRFDGMKFDVFNPQNTPQLPSGGIVNLHVDGRGWLWISTFAGVVTRMGKQWRVFGPEQGWTYPGDFIRTSAERRNGDLLFTTFHGGILEFAHDRLTRLPTPPGQTNMGYFGCVDAESDQWWVAQHGFIGRWDGQRWIPMVTAAELAGVSSEAVASAPAQGGGLWLLLGPELRRYRNNAELYRLQLAELPGGVWSICEDSRTNVWVCTHDRGVYRVSPDGSMRRWSTTNSLLSNGTRLALEDREKNVWVGTSGGGLLRYKPRRFQSFAFENSLAERAVNSVSAHPDGSVWLATYGRRLFRLNETGLTVVPVAGSNGGPAYVRSVLVDRDARVWAGAYGGGLWCSSPQGFRQLPHVPGDNLVALFQDAKGRIWAGDGRGVTVIDGSESSGYGPEQGLPNGGVRCFAQDKAGGAVWFANAQGVFHLDHDQLVEVRDSANRPLTEVNCLKFDEDGTLWMGIMNKGLLRRRSGALAQVDPACGLPAADIYGILEDDEHFFWMSSNRGVVRTHRNDLESVADGVSSRLRCQLLDLNDGLPSVQCASGGQPTCARDAKGRFWFATVRGVAMTDPARFRLNTVPPPVRIETVLFNTPGRADKPFLRRASIGQAGDGSTEEFFRREAPFEKPLVLPAGSQHIEIQYTALSFTAPEKVRFQVMLEGYDSDWHDAGAHRAVNFYELPPREYLFRIRAANSDGIWNEAGASLAFTVAPFFWQTMWFRLVLALSLGLGGGAAVWFWLRSRLRRDAERLQDAQEIRQLAGRLINAQEAERARLARELHDDFSQRLALLSVQLEMFGQRPPPEPKETATRMQELSARVKDISAEVHRMSHELHPAKLEQLGLVAAARSFCKEMAATHQLDVSFDHRNVPSRVPAETALCLYRVLQEALQNVVKHSQAISARVTLTGDTAELHLTIVDDGEGCRTLAEAGQRSAGLGLASMQERVQLVNGRLTFRSSPGEGTRVQASVPAGSG
ncbi:MAG TPA: two-component regulator propeller domain-containing protein [Verrucomicrobiae bacterium]|nr:two-component regulator propeller domain-containing protein [Verrucomicrobiae bacterium]